MLGGRTFNIDGDKWRTKIVSDDLVQISVTPIKGLIRKAV